MSLLTLSLNYISWWTKSSVSHNVPCDYVRSCNLSIPFFLYDCVIFDFFLLQLKHMGVYFERDNLYGQI